MYPDVMNILIGNNAKIMKNEASISHNPLMKGLMAFSFWAPKFLLKVK